MAEKTGEKGGKKRGFAIPWNMRDKESQELRQLAIDRVIKGGESVRRVSKDLKLNTTVLEKAVNSEKYRSAVPAINRQDYSIPQSPEEGIKNFLIDQAFSVAPELAKLRKKASKTLGQAHEGFSLIIQHATKLLQRGFEIVEVETDNGVINVPKLLGFNEIKGLSSALKSAVPELAALHGWSYGAYRPDRLSKTQDLHQHNHLHLSSKGGKAGGPQGLKPAAIIKEVQAVTDCQFTDLGDASPSAIRLLESAEE